MMLYMLPIQLYEIEFGNENLARDKFHNLDAGATIEPSPS